MHNPLENQQQLLDFARTACDYSYSPYSELKVGAALLTKDGEIFCGTNIENISYSVTLCAERAAIATAVSKGQKDFRALALTYSGGNLSPDKILAPCGVCRQALMEFAKLSNYDMEIIMMSADQKNKTICKLSELLPFAMGL
jgi:cytidine deaminase